MPACDGRVDLKAGLQAAAKAGLHRILVEGGAQIHRTLLDQGLVDTIEMFLAPKLIPGGLPWVGGPAIEALADGAEFTLISVGQVGSDAHLRFRCRHQAQPVWEA